MIRYLPTGPCNGHLWQQATWSVSRHDSVLHKPLLLSGYSKMAIILQMRFSDTFSLWKFSDSNIKFTLRTCWVIAQFKPSCHWSHIPMANTLRRRQICLPFVSHYQDTTSIIHDARGLNRWRLIMGGALWSYFSCMKTVVVFCANHL